MNPPFSDKSWSDGISPANDVYHRFDGYGIPPEKNGDWAWFLHVLKSLTEDGKAAIIMPHGILFRGNAEEVIRKQVLERKYITGIVSLPANLFYGTGIPACIVVIDKENADDHEGIFMIDASQGFKKDGNKNRLREQDIERIVLTFNQRLEVVRAAAQPRRTHRANHSRRDAHRTKDRRDHRSADSMGGSLRYASAAWSG